jgi:hypothetical protein
MLRHGSHVEAMQPDTVDSLKSTFHLDVEALRE